jgi:hypothetical protein
MFISILVSILQMKIIQEWRVFLLQFFSFSYSTTSLCLFPVQITVKYYVVYCFFTNKLCVASLKWKKFFIRPFVHATALINISRINGSEIGTHLYTLQYFIHSIYAH